MQMATNPLEWTRFSTQKSRAIRLLAGRTYYIELLHKQSVGDSHCAIAWASGTAAPALISSQFLRTWASSLTDRDSDFLSDTAEAALGLDPLLPADAYADSDNDGISNLREYRAFSNPLSLDSVAGYLLDEVWLQVPGDKMNRAAYKAAATRVSDLRDVVTITQASDKGDNYVRRIRGYLTASESGEYQFWGTADDDVDFHLSTTASKFQIKQIISNNVLGGSSYDIDPSQQSPLIKLVAGERYYFELWHKEGMKGSRVQRQL
jgi:hypothetical protein